MNNVAETVDPIGSLVELASRVTRWIDCLVYAFSNVIGRKGNPHASFDFFENCISRGKSARDAAADLGGLRRFQRSGTVASGPGAAKPTTGGATAEKPQVKDEKKVPEMNLLDAMRAGPCLRARPRARGDGRMSLSVTNRSKRQLRVILPPGIIAQSATGQFGGMGGMGGGMGGMGGGMMGGMGGGMGGMGGGMGGMGGGMGGGGMGGMGGMGRTSGTMPSMMGMMMLSRMIMYFCGDPDSWDMRSLMIGMMGGMMGGMGGGGMMGGMGGGMMGGMGGGMRSVPPPLFPPRFSTSVRHGTCRRDW